MKPTYKAKTRGFGRMRRWMVEGDYYGLDKEAQEFLDRFNNAYHRGVRTGPGSADTKANDLRNNAARRCVLNQTKPVGLEDCSEPSTDNVEVLEGLVDVKRAWEKYK